MSIDLRTHGRDPAWDDGELIRAYDAALEEFHTHHPGPGSWLDKVTALKGQAVDGAKAFGTSWYTGQKRKQEPDDITPNPYSAQVAKRKTKQKSPSYTPPSPSSSTSHQEAPMSIQSASQASYDEAISYAMSAQYAAGYWLGVAHAKAAQTGVDTNIIYTRREFPGKLKR